MHRRMIGGKMEKVEEIIKEAIRMLKDYNPQCMRSRDESRFNCIDFLKNSIDMKDD